MVQFTCPHCHETLYGEMEQVGQTNPCPQCNGLVRLESVQREMTTKEAVTTGILVGILTAIFG